MNIYNNKEWVPLRRENLWQWVRGSYKIRVYIALIKNLK